MNEGEPSAEDWSGDVSRVPEGEWSEVDSRRIEHDPIDHSGPWRVASTGAALDVFSVILLESLPAHQLEVEVMGNPAVYGTIVYDPLDLEYVMGNGWKVEVRDGAGIMRSGDLLVQRRHGGEEMDEAEEELREMLSKEDLS